LREGSDAWQHSEDGTMHWFCREMELPQGTERWLIVRTKASQQRAQQSMQRQAGKARASWEQKCWHLSNRRFACEADARAALERELKGKPGWLEVHRDLVAHPQYTGKGRPRKGVSPVAQQWQIVATVSVNQEQVEQEALRKACWIIGTNILDATVLSDLQLVTTYKEQGGVERGFRFLKDPLFLASSVFVKKTERIMVLCLLVYRLAEVRLRAGLAETKQTIPDQVHKPTACPTCVGSFNALKASSYSTCRPLPLRSSLFSAYSLSIALFCSS
jgi:transposase